MYNRFYRNTQLQVIGGIRQLKSGNEVTWKSAAAKLSVWWNQQNGILAWVANVKNLGFFKIRASADGQQEDDCNVEECAPDKETDRLET
nr:protein maintenance of PSII under high light 1 [Tanacetum cinerariifolium]